MHENMVEIWDNDTYETSPVNPETEESESSWVFDKSRKDQELLQREIYHKRTYQKLDFHLDISSIPEKWANIIRKLKEKYDNDDSLEWALLGNPQVQNLLAQIVSQYANDWDFMRSWGHKKSKIVKDNADNNEDNDKNLDDAVESREDYIWRESNYEKFEEWLLSRDWIRALINAIDDHIDENWNLIKNFPIDKKDLKLKLEKAWLCNLRFNYNINNNLFDDDEKKKLNDMWKVVQDGVNLAVKNCLTAWNTTFNDNTVRQINSIIFAWENNKFLKWLQENSKEKDEFGTLLRDYINNYSNLVLKKNGDKIVDVNLNTWSYQLDLQLRSYLFIYGKTFIPEVFYNQGWDKYESSLTTLLTIILSDDYKELEKKIVNKALLEKIKKAEEERRLRDLQRRQEAAKRNRERNNRLPSNKGSEWEKQKNITKNPSDINEQSGAQIAENVKLNDFGVDNNLSEIADSPLLKQKAFWVAWENFTKNNDLVKDIFTPKDMRKLYDVETNSINMQSRKDFLDTDIMRWRSQEEIHRIYLILSSFPNEYTSALNNLTSKVNEQEWLVNDKIRNHALWAVIDNVKLIFSNIVEKWKWDSKFEWFKFNETEPVKRQWNDIIISGTFDWKKIKVRYDLISWWLFMNSYIKQSLNPTKFTIWNNSEPNFKIGQLDSFDTILNKNYNTPDVSFENNANIQTGWERPILNPDKQTPGYNNEPVNHVKLAANRNMDKIKSLKQKYTEMFDMNLGLIEDKIIDNTRKQSLKNSVIINFMKTFNVMFDGQEDTNIDFNDWSNLYDFIQLVENSDSNTLNKFQILMGKVCDYSGLDRWSNNILGSQTNQKSDITFNENNKNKYISMIRENANLFSDSPWKFMWKLDFGSDSQLWFIQMIKENITNDVSKPNRKLDLSKIDTFIYHLDTDGKES